VDENGRVQNKPDVYESGGPELRASKLSAFYLWFRWRSQENRKKKILL